MRIGQGYDVHKLVEGRKLILGGVGIPYEKGLLGHSDADVLVHAVMVVLSPFRWWLLCREAETVPRTDRPPSARRA